MATFDPTLKALVELAPADWLVFLGEPPAPVEVIDADVATVSGAADKVIRVRSDPDWLLHLEFHSGHDGAQLPSLIHVRNALLDKRHQLPVESVAIVLTRAADSPQLSGTYQRRLPQRGQPHLTFGYEVRRIWEIDAQALLGGLGTMPLAPISNVTDAEVPGIIKQMEQHLRSRRVRKADAIEMWSATNILLGLRYSAEFAQQLLQGVRGMKESTTYQAIAEEGRAEGRVEEARELLIRLGSPSLGVPDDTTRRQLQAIVDLSRLHEMLDRMRTVASWSELLGPLPTPTPTPPRRRRGS